MPAAGGSGSNAGKKNWQVTGSPTSAKSPSGTAVKKPEIMPDNGPVATAESPPAAAARVGPQEAPARRQVAETSSEEDNSPWAATGPDTADPAARSDTPPLTSGNSALPISVNGPTAIRQALAPDRHCGNRRGSGRAGGIGGAVLAVRSVIIRIFRLRCRVPEVKKGPLGTAGIEGGENGRKQQGVRRVVAACSTWRRRGSNGAAQAFSPAIRQVVHRHLHRRLRGKFDSTDFTQDAWTSFFANPDAHADLDGPESFVRIMKCIAMNKVSEVTRQRLEGQKFNVQQEHSLNSSFLNGAEDLAADQPTPSQIMMNEEEWQQFLKGQPPVHRRILTLLRKGKQPPEIATRLGLSSRTIYRLISRMLERTGPSC